MSATAFIAERIALVATTLYPVYAPRACRSVSIGNETGGTVQISTDDDGSHYIDLADGFERTIEVESKSSTSRWFGQTRPPQPDFWLYGPNSGTVILLWT